MTLLRKMVFLKQIVKPRKVYNLFLKEIQRLLGHSRLYYFPNKLTIDIGNVCNLKCPLCPTGRGDNSSAKGLMKIEPFKKVIDEMGSYLTKLELYNWGEPLLNKDLIAMVRYAKAKNIPVSISTNLNIMDEKIAEDLISTNIDKIFISFDGASPETYSKYRVGGDFQKVLSNIRLLQGAKKRLKNRYTRLILLFHVFRHNEHEIETIRQLTRSLGIELRINKMRTDMGKEIFERVAESIERDKDWIPENPKYSAFDLVKKEKRKPMTCRQLWTTTVVNWEGSILPCCAVYSERYAFGNIFEEPFMKIWNNQNYRLARKEIVGKIEKSPTVCHICKENDFLHF